MSKKDLIKQYKENMCSRCVGKCNKGITVFKETTIIADEVKEVLCVKCTDYKTKKVNKPKNPAYFQSW